MRSFTRTTGALAAVMLLAAGCGDAETNGGGTTTDDSDLQQSIDLREGYDPNATFRFGYLAGISSWDPAKSPQGGDMFYYRLVYDRLLDMNVETSEIEPQLADFEVSDDGMSLTLKIKPDITLSDGTPLDAEVVKYNIDRNRAPGSLLITDMLTIQSVEVVDPMTVEVKVSGSMQVVLESLANRGGAIVSPAAAEAGLLDQGPVGVGPFTLTEDLPGDQSTYTATENYWRDDVVHVKEIVVKVIPDDNARGNALRSGELDGISLNSDEIDSAMNEGFQVVARPSSIAMLLLVNSAHEHLNNGEVMRAINMSIDRQSIADGLYNGKCTPSANPFPEGSVGYTDKVGNGLDAFPYDPAQAKQILEEQGASDLSMTVTTVNITQYVALTEVIQSQLKEAGITITVKPGPVATVVDDFALSKTASGMIAPNTMLPDPVSGLGQMVIPGSLWNPGQYIPPKLAELANKAAVPFDPEERTPIYEEFVDAWIEEPPYSVPICFLYTAAAYSDKVSNASIGIFSGHGGLEDIALHTD